MNTIQLLTESILQVPILSYPKDFTFIVNNEEFQTTKLVACLLSSKISKIHQIDPTLCHYTINTKYRGDFQHFLDILNFQTTNISETELSFFSEIIDQLETEKVNLNINTPEINSDNVTLKCDIYSLGQIIYFIMKGKNPVKNEIDFFIPNVQKKIRLKGQLLLTYFLIFI